MVNYSTTCILVCTRFLYFLKNMIIFLHRALGSKDLGYESDSNLIIRKRDQDLRTASPLSPLSPAEQKHAYAEIQRGGEVPLQGISLITREYDL